MVEGFPDVFIAPGPFPTRLAHIARSGWWAGEAAAATRGPRPAGVIARTRVTLLHLPSAALEGLGRDGPIAWRRLCGITTAHMGNAL